MVGENRFSLRIVYLLFASAASSQSHFFISHKHLFSWIFSSFDVSVVHMNSLKVTCEVTFVSCFECTVFLCAIQEWGTLVRKSKSKKLMKCDKCGKTGLRSDNMDRHICYCKSRPHSFSPLPLPKTSRSQATMKPKLRGSDALRWIPPYQAQQRNGGFNLILERWLNRKTK